MSVLVAARGRQWRACEMTIATGYPILSADVNAALAARLQLAGGTMTGLLTLAQDPIGPLDAVTKEYLSSTVSAAPFLPLAGGTMTGPLFYTATGGTVARSAQDRAADVANVLDFGADPTGVADSTAAFNSAIATAKEVYIPAGHYLINNTITVNAGQRIRGAGTRATILTIGSTFNMSAQAVIVLAAGSKEQDVELRDFWIRFSQPSFSGMTRANIIQYPPGIDCSQSDRQKLINLQISNAWVAINEGGAGFFDRLEISCYSCGLSLGIAAPNLDGTHISNFHLWNFDQTSFQYTVANDGNTIAMNLGRSDGLVGENWEIIQSQIVVNNTAGSAGFYFISNLMMDGQNSRIIVNDCLRFVVNGGYFSHAAPYEVPCISVTGGRGASFYNFSIDSSMASTTAVQVTGGYAHFSGGPTWWKEGVGASMFTVSGGTLELTDIAVASHTGAHTAPVAWQSGTGVLIVNNMTNFNGLTGPGIQMDTVVAGNRIGSINYLGGLTLVGPGIPTATQINVRSNPPSTLAQLVTGSIGGVNAQEGKLRFFGSFPTGADSNSYLAASLRGGYNAVSWQGSYLNVWLTNTTNSAGDDANTVNAAGFLTTGFWALNVRTGSATGPTWTTGAGAPSSTQPIGSLYSNTSGASGARLYVSAGGGTWNAVAGV